MAVPGYNVDDVTRRLRAIGALSEAAEVLGRLLPNDETSPEQVAIAVRFWQCALQGQPSADMLPGFGWYAKITGLDDATWADLTRRTVTVTHGRIDGVRDVAERAARTSPSADTLETLNQLVRGGDESWEQPSILKAASAAIISASHPLTESREYERLRTALLERGAEVAPPPQGTAPDDAPDDSPDPEQ